MIADLKPYPAMEDSGVEWLGEVPSHWTRLPGRACYREKKVPNKGLTETTVLSLSYGHIVVKPPEQLHGLVPSSFETYQIVEPGDIIVRPTDLQNDWNSLRFGLSRNRGVITSAYMCLYTEVVVMRPYGHLLLHTYDLKKVFYGLGSGLRQNLDWRDFKYLPCIVPPLPEQAAIVRYLDHADRRIQRYIRAKQKLIQLLEEQKQAIIHRAVTRGLDPNVRLKPSGVEWLGEVPEHWEVKPLKHWVREPAKMLGEKTDPDYEFDYLDISCVGTGFLASTPEKRRFKNAPSRARQIVEKGDTLISTVRTYLKAVYFIGDDWPDLIASTGFAVLRPIDDVHPKLLGYVLQNSSFIERVMTHSIGVTYPAISETKLGILHIFIPVDRQEQLLILRSLDKATADTDSAIDRARRQIELLREYRIRLIANVVTGKLDVREAAARLPDEVEEPEPREEPREETDALTDGEEPTDDLDTAPEEAAV